MTSPIHPSCLQILLGVWGQARTGDRDPGDDAGALASVSQATFREVVMEEMLRRPGESTGQATHVFRDGAGVPSPETSVPAPPPAFAFRAASPAENPPGEAEVIAREAGRVGIDPALLAALRRVENGASGREFGVLTVPAAGIEEQARVAANTIRKTMVRFAQQGGEVVDPASGRHTEAFLRFFSARYAPPGAANDPSGLNRHHAANLIAVYRRMSGERFTS